MNLSKKFIPLKNSLLDLKIIICGNSQIQNNQKQNPVQGLLPGIGRVGVFWNERQEYQG